MGYDCKRIKWLKDTLTVQNKYSLILGTNNNYAEQVEQLANPAKVNCFRYHMALAKLKLTWKLENTMIEALPLQWRYDIHVYVAYVQFGARHS